MQMKIKKLGALLVSAALCAGMAAPAFAFEGEAAPVEQPVLPEVVEEDVVTTPTIPMAVVSSSSRWCRSRVQPFIWSLTATPRDSRPSTL